MPQIALRYCDNQNVKFLHIVNFLVDRNAMTLADASPLYRRFKSGEDIMFDIPVEIADAFRAELAFLNCKVE